MNNSFIVTGIDNIIHFSDKAVAQHNILSNELVFLRFSEEGESQAKAVYFLSQNGEKNIYSKLENVSEAYILCFHANIPISCNSFFQNNTNYDILECLFKRAFQIWASKREGYYLECMSILYNILYIIHLKNYMPKNKFSRIDPAVKYMEENYLLKINYDDLAKMCGISYSYFKRLFIERFGISPQKYIISQKINHSCNLLKSGKLSINKVAELSGFKDAYYFSRTFKKYMGVSPTKYK